MTPALQHFLESLAGAGIATLSGLLGYGYRQAKRRGIQEAMMKELADKVAAHTETILSHTAQLAAGEGNFKVIDNKLDNIGKTVDKMAEKIERHCEKDG